MTLLIVLISMCLGPCNFDYMLVKCPGFEFKGPARLWYLPNKKTWVVYDVITEKLYPITPEQCTIISRPLKPIGGQQ